MDDTELANEKIDKLNLKREIEELKEQITLKEIEESEGK